MPELFGLLFLAAGGWYLWSNLKAREIANAAISSACKAAGFLFLNDTVGLDSVRPVRDEEGRLTLRRIFGFEYSDTGHERRRGTVTLVGGEVTALDLGQATSEGVTLH
jgi:Protein of unknown function (DUF3301)